MPHIKRSPKNFKTDAKKTARLNFKAIGIIGVILLVLICVFIFVKIRSTDSLREAALAQSKDNFERREYDLAIRHLDRFLAENPDDIVVLDAKADILSKTAVTADRILLATQVHDQLIRLDPDGKDRLATRRRLIELYIAYGELVRVFADGLNDSRIEANESRYLAAVEAADELIKYKDKKTGIENGTIDAAAHRLKAIAYMGQVPGLIAKKTEDSFALDEAEKELDKALAIDSNDIIASEKLAELYMIHRRNPIKSEETLDRMLTALKEKKFATTEEAKDAALKVRLSRFRAFYNTRDMAKAQRELEAALQNTPKNPELLLDILTSAAGLALQRNETQECRRYLEAIPVQFQKDNLRVRLLRGELEFAERHPDEAIDQWRKGLSLVGGGDQDLTWRLAANLIQFSRLIEARPLIEQYKRLAKPNDPKGIYLEAMFSEKSGMINEAIELMSKVSNLVPTAFKSDVLMSLGHCYELIGDEAKAMYTYKSAANLGGAATGPRRAMARLYLATNPNRAIEELETAYSASKASAKSKITPAEGCNLILLPSIQDAAAIPSRGKNQVIIAMLEKVVYFRFFDVDGKTIVDTDETRLRMKSGLIRELRDQLQKLWPPHRLTKQETEDVLTLTTSIVDPDTGDSKGDPNILIDLIRIKLDRIMKLAKADRNFSEIAKLLAEAQQIAPQNPAIQGLMAQYQSYSNRLDLAVKTLEETVKGGNRKRVEAWLAYAEALELLGRFSDAVGVLDQGSAPDAAGDHAALRSTKARLLLRMGQGQLAREVLTTNVESIPSPERPELSKALGDLLQELGDRSGAREAYTEWAALAPESPFPALKLLSIAQLDGDEETAKAGLDALWKAGRQNEPYALAAQALQLLRSDPNKPGPISNERLAEAQKKVEKLNLVAPDFPVKYMIEGMILEAMADPKDPKKWKESLTKAGEAFRKSIKIGASSPALPKLIEIYMKLNDNEKLNLLKVEYDDGTRRLKTEISIEFDRLCTLIALKLGKREQAEANLVKMVDGRPDNPEFRFAYARLLVNEGKIAEAEATLLGLIRTKPDDPIGWIEMIRFQAAKKTPADVARTIEEVRQKYNGDRPELLIAQCYWLGNDLPNANREYQKAVDLRPDDLVTLRSLVAFREATNQGDQVEPILRKILKIDPSATWATRNLALRLSARSDPAAWAEAWNIIAPGQTQVGDSPDDRLVRATVLARSQESSKRADAIPAFTALVKDLPLSNSVGIEARLRLSQAMLEIDRADLAWQYISPLCDDQTRANAMSLGIGIEALARIGKGDDAEKRLNRLVRIIPDTASLTIYRAWVAYAQGKKKEVAAILLGAAEKSEKEAEGEAVAVTCLNLLVRFNDLDSALVLAKKMAARWPRQAGNLARIQVARKEYDDALGSCLIALEKGSARDAVQYATASAVARHEDPGFLNKVEGIINQGRGKYPNDFNILVYMATLRHVQGRYDEELAFYRMALEKNPPNRQFLNNMAWTLSEGAKNPEEAIKQIEEIIKRDGPSSQYLDTRGVIQIRRQNYAKAIEDLEKSVKLDPAATTYFHLARAYYKAGNLAESHRCRDIALAKGFDTKGLDPTDRSDLEEVMGRP